MQTTDAFSCPINIRFSDRGKSTSLMRKLYYQLCGAVAKCLVLGINFLQSPISFVIDLKHLLSLLMWHQIRKNSFHQKILRRQFSPKISHTVETFLSKVLFSMCTLLKLKGTIKSLHHQSNEWKFSNTR